jgi:hypothetical protein
MWEAAGTVTALKMTILARVRAGLYHLARALLLPASGGGRGVAAAEYRASAWAVPLLTAMPQ